MHLDIVKCTLLSKMKIWSYMQKWISYSLLYDSPQQTNNAAIFLSCDFNIAIISPIRTPSAYEVISKRKWPNIYEWM